MHKSGQVSEQNRIGMLMHTDENTDDHGPTCVYLDKDSHRYWLYAHAHRSLHLQNSALTALPPGIFDLLVDLRYVPLSSSHAHVLLLLKMRDVRQWYVCLQMRML